jgi:hypothetical protein
MWSNDTFSLLTFRPLIYLARTLGVTWTDSIFIVDEIKAQTGEWAFLAENGKA